MSPTTRKAATVTGEAIKTHSGWIAVVLAVVGFLTAYMQAQEAKELARIEQTAASETAAASERELVVAVGDLQSGLMLVNRDLSVAERLLRGERRKSRALEQRVNSTTTRLAVMEYALMQFGGGLHMTPPRVGPVPTPTPTPTPRHPPADFDAGAEPEDQDVGADSVADVADVGGADAVVADEPGKRKLVLKPVKAVWDEIRQRAPKPPKLPD